MRDVHGAVVGQRLSEETNNRAVSHGSTTQKHHRTLYTLLPICVNASQLTEDGGRGGGRRGRGNGERRMWERVTEDGGRGRKEEKKEKRKRTSAPIKSRQTYKD